MYFVVPSRAQDTIIYVDHQLSVSLADAAKMRERTDARMPGQTHGTDKRTHASNIQLSYVIDSHIVLPLIGANLSRERAGLAAGDSGYQRS